jgi:hypothetical protein
MVQSGTIDRHCTRSISLVLFLVFLTSLVNAETGTEIRAEGRGIVVRDPGGDDRLA